MISLIKYLLSKTSLLATITGSIEEVRAREVSLEHGTRPIVMGGQQYTGYLTKVRVLGMVLSVRSRNQYRTDEVVPFKELWQKRDKNYFLPKHKQVTNS